MTSFSLLVERIDPQEFQASQPCTHTHPIDLKAGLNMSIVKSLHEVMSIAGTGVGSAPYGIKKSRIQEHYALRDVPASVCACVCACVCLCKCVRACMRVCVNV